MPKRFVFSTASPHPDDRAAFQEWHKNISDGLNMNIVPLTANSVKIECSVYAFGDVGLNRWISSALETNITDSHVQTALNTFSLSFPQKGRLSISQRRHDDFGAGQSRFLRLDEKCIFRINGDCDLPGIFVPVPVLLSRLPSAEERILNGLSPDNPTYSFLVDYMAMARNRAGLDETTRHLIGEQLLDIVVHLLAPSSDRREAVVNGGLKEARRVAILNYIEANFSDPTLNLNTSVDRIGLSRTYIQALLDEAGFSFSEKLRDARLNQARRLLGDRHHGHLSIAAIAYDCGFSEISTFYRLFRAKFGDTPSAVRGHGREV